MKQIYGPFPWPLNRLCFHNHIAPCKSFIKIEQVQKSGILFPSNGGKKENKTWDSYLSTKESIY